MTMGMHLLGKAYLCKYFAAAWFIIRLAAFFFAFGAIRVFMVVTCYFCITYQCIAIYM